MWVEGQKRGWLRAKDWFPYRGSILPGFVRRLKIMRKLKIGGCYRHFRGKKYRVLGVAKHTETGEELVVYQALGGMRGIWARPKKMFLEKVNQDGKTFYRFEYLGE